MNDLVCRRPLFVGGEFRRLGIGVSEGLVELMKGLEVSLIPGLNSFFDTMVAGDPNRVGRLHGGEAGLFVSERLPEGEPVLGGLFFFEKSEKF